MAQELLSQLHGSNLGTVKDLNPKVYPSNTVIVHMDKKPGPRLCMKENVSLITTRDYLFCKREFICNNPDLLKLADQHGGGYGKFCQQSCVINYLFE